MHFLHQPGKIASAKQKLPQYTNNRSRERLFVFKKQQNYFRLADLKKPLHGLFQQPAR
jgi:hypothetical protein